MKNKKIILSIIMLLCVIVLFSKFTIASCGDSYVDTGEACDSGSANDIPCTAAYGATCYTCYQCQYNAPTRGHYCGDLSVDSAYGETCDDGSRNTNNPSASYGQINYPYCTTSCNSATIKGSYCGDSILDSAYGEVCDLGTGKFLTSCTTSYDQSCSYCANDCRYHVTTGPYCGDGVINGNEQCDGNAASAFTCTDFGKISSGTQGCNNDCTVNGCTKIPGWYVLSYGWSVDSTNNALTSSNGAKIQSDSLDLIAGKDYILSANVLSGSATFKLSTTCFSPVTSAEQECNIDYTNSGTLSIGSAGTGAIVIHVGTNTKGTATTNPNTMNNGVFFKGVKLIVTTTGASSIKDISLKEAAASGIHYDTVPSTQITGCCPSDYCWNGSVCMNSDLWMNNASYGPVWNNVNIFSLNNNHVNSLNVSNSTGYRCTADTSGVATWTPSSVKYDWNYEKSGYCANVTDCFVDYTDDFGGSSRGCTHNGTIVGPNAAGSLTISTGNNYCYAGNWTTKSYIIASLLQDVAANREYTLSCYDDMSLVYNILPADSGSNFNIISACVLTMKGTPQNTQIITGIVLEDETLENLDRFIDSVKADYENNAVGTATLLDPKCTGTDAVTFTKNPQFSDCIKASGIKNDDLKVYYNSPYKFFIISNKKIDTIEGTSTWQFVWNKFTTFVKSIFVKPIVTIPYKSVSYTSSYDKIYILRELNNLQVTGIEESKYDEDQGKVVTVLYINYTGGNSQSNPLNVTEFNKTLFAKAQRDGITIINTTYSVATNETLIKSDTRTGMWQYFTTILRTS